MATPEYHAWVADGRPWKLARPLSEIRDRMVAAGWPAREIGTLGRDAPSHLQNARPKDHCPFSKTGRPPPHTYPYVTAVDYMHRPKLGLDCEELFRYRIAEARAGRTPWTKYLIWQFDLYDVRDGWTPSRNKPKPHLDHIHESILTTWVDKSIGDWSPLPEEDDVSAADVWAALLPDPVQRNPGPGGAGDLLFRGFWHALDAKTEAVAARAAAERAAADAAALRNMITAILDAGIGADTATVVAKMQELADADRARDEAHSREVAELHAQLAALRQFAVARERADSAPAADPHEPPADQ